MSLHKDYNTTYHSERYIESVEFINKAFRLNPFPPSYYFLFLGHSKRGLKKYDEAVEAYRKAAQLEPNNLFSHLQFNVVNLRDWFIIRIKFSGRYSMLSRILSTGSYRFGSIDK